jgi:hypothetical protein
MASLAGALIGVGSSLFGGLFGASKAKKAGEAESDAANQARGVIAGNQNQALGLESGMYDTTRRDMLPFLTAGQGAITKLSDLLNNGSLTPQPFQAPTAADETNDPGYNFRLAQGMKAIDAGAAARGTVLSGGQIQAEQNYGQDYASNEFGNVYQRALNNYQLGIQNQTNTFNRYASLAGFGSTAAHDLGAIGTTTTGQEASTLGVGGQEQAQQLDAAGQAKAAGIVGASNAFTGGIAGAAGSLTDLLNSMKNARGTSYTGASVGGG